MSDIERLADVLHEAKCGPVLWRGSEEVQWSDDHREWDLAVAKAISLLGVSLSSEPASTGLDARTRAELLHDAVLELRAGRGRLSKVTVADYERVLAALDDPDLPRRLSVPSSPQDDPT